MTDLDRRDIRRFAPFNGNVRWLRPGGRDPGGALRNPWPNRNSPPPVRFAPFAGSTAGRRERGTSAAGWAGRPNFFAPADRQPTIEYTWGKPIIGLVGGPAAKISTRTAVQRLLTRRRSPPVVGRTPNWSRSGCAPTTSRCRWAVDGLHRMLWAPRGTYGANVCGHPVCRSFVVSGAATTERDQGHIWRNMPGRAPRVAMTSRRRWRCSG